MSTKKRLLFGAHISVEGGYHKALERGASIGCTAIQIFTKSNRQWSAKPITKKEANTFKATQKELNISCVVAHASYLINLASPKDEIHAKSINALTKELDRCNQLAIPFLVLHPGSRLTSDPKEALQKIARGVDDALEKSTGTTMILLETMAGQGSTMGATFEEIATIYKQIKNKSRVGVCLDTCHIFAAGYTFNTKATYSKIWEEFKSTIGIRNLKAIHVNDSKKELGSRVDRHEDIGAGKIGETAFKLLFNDPELYNIPKILETPKESLDDDKRNMEKIKALLTKETCAALKVTK